MPEQNHDDFFVGYLPGMPGSHGRAVKRFVASLGVFVLGMSVMLVSLMNRPAPATWDPDAKSIEGTLVLCPYPVLFVADGAGTRPVLVVATRKFGAAEQLRPLDGSAVRLRGTTLQRGMLVLFELSDAADAAVRTGQGSPPRVIDRGEVRLRGEIVDTKCYAGAMKPGEGKEHRDCAVRCISGGIPPGLARATRDGVGTVSIIAPSVGEAITEAILPYVGEQVELTGRLESLSGLEIVRIDEQGLRRIE